MEKLLFVVSPERRDLYEALRQLLAGERDVDVMLDRRTNRRRVDNFPHAVERRRYSRRTRTAMDAEVQERGWTVVRLP